MEKRAKHLVPGDVVRFVNQGNKTIAEVKDGAVRSKHTNRPYNVVWVRWEGEAEFTWKISSSSWVSLATDVTCEDCGIPIPLTDKFCGPCSTMQDWSSGN